MRKKGFYISFLKSILDSYTQIFFSNNLIFAVILIVVTFFDYITGLTGLISVITANGVAYLVGFNRTMIKQGYYGFNSLLVGLGIGMFYQQGPQFFVIVIFASVLTLFLTLVLEGVIGKYALPYLSIPFIIGIWLVFLASRQFSSLHLSERGVYSMNEMYALGGMGMVRIYEWFNQIPLPKSVIVYFRSMGAIFFQYHLFPGLLISLGLLIYSRIAFTLSWIGFYAAYIFYQIVGADLTVLNYAYIGFNYILTAIAIGGFFIIPSKYSYLWTILLTPLVSILLTATTSIFMIFQLSIYSLPFNMIVLIFLYALKFRETNFSKPELVYYQQFSPEKNLYDRVNVETRFSNFLGIWIGLPFYGEWTVTQSHNGKFTHKDNWKHAWDFEITDEEGKPFRKSGQTAEEYYCFNKPVLAPADGWIESTTDGIDDNPVGEVNLAQNWGNTIVIRHAEQVFSALSHLKKASFKVSKGDFVKKGDVVASCGNSGRSPVPHLHFQMQSTPQPGSKTMDFPVSHYILHKNDRFDFRSFERPVEKDIISNIGKNTALQKAFNFIPGQKFNLVVKEPGDNLERHVTWEIQADSSNNTYIFCHDSECKAFFRNEGDMFYFTHFDGDRKSLLFYFYLGNFKIIFGYYKNLQVKDSYPIHMVSPFWWKIIQDFLAPFYLFIRADFTLEYADNSRHMDEGHIYLTSNSRIMSGKRVVRSLQFKTHIRNNALETIQVRDQKTVILEAAWENE
jgi:urea transporter